MQTLSKKTCLTTTHFKLNGRCHRIHFRGIVLVDTRLQCLGADRILGSEPILQIDGVSCTIIATLALLIIVGGIWVLLWLRVRQP